MTGAGAPGAPGIIKCLLQDSRIRLTVADADQNATGKYIHGNFVQIPKATDPVFAPLLLSICKKKGVHIVLPLVTKELLPLARHKHAFEAEGVKVLVSSEKSIEIANNKSACYTFLQKQGIAVPKFHVAKTTEEFIAAAAELGYPENSFCFKPSFSNGSRGFRIVDDSINEANQLFQQKPYNVYITYAQILKILSAQPFPELLVSEYLPKEEYSVDCIARHGETIVAVPRLRSKMVNGISVQGQFVPDEGIIGYCRKIIAAINLHGNIGIQVKLSASNEPMLLEINPRVQGTIVAGLGAGINLPVMAVLQEFGFQKEPQDLNIGWGRKFSRYWTEVFY